MSWFAPLLRLAHALLDLFMASRRQNRVDTVRADPGAEWVRKFGGTDKRAGNAAPGPAHTGGRGDR